MTAGEFKQTVLARLRECAAELEARAEKIVQRAAEDLKRAEQGLLDSVSFDDFDGQIGRESYDRRRVAGYPWPRVECPGASFGLGGAVACRMRAAEARCKRAHDALLDAKREVRPIEAKTAWLREVAADIADIAVPREGRPMFELAPEK